MKRASTSKTASGLNGFGVIPPNISDEQNGHVRVFVNALGLG